MKDNSMLNKMPSEDIIRKINVAVLSGYSVDLGNGTEVYAESNRVSFFAQITRDALENALKYTDEEGYRLEIYKSVIHFSRTVYMEDTSFFEAVKMLNEYQDFYETYCDIMGIE